MPGLYVADQGGGWVCFAESVANVEVKHLIKFQLQENEAAVQ